MVDEQVVLVRKFDLRRGHFRPKHDTRCTSTLPTSQLHFEWDISSVTIVGLWPRCGCASHMQPRANGDSLQHAQLQARVLQLSLNDPTQANRRAPSFMLRSGRTSLILHDSRVAEQLMTPSLPN